MGRLKYLKEDGFIVKKYLEAGKIVTTHGLAGAVKVQPWCDSPEFFCRFKRLYSKDGSICYDVAQTRIQGNMVILKIKGVDTIEKAQSLRNLVLYLDRADSCLEKGTYFVADLIGLSVVGEDGKTYGVLSDVLKTGANDVYEIKTASGKPAYIPAIPSVIVSTDIENGRLVISPMEGLFDDED